MADLRWVTAFVDHPVEVSDAAAAFWSDVTGWPLSPARGDRGQWATYLPPDASAYLKTQSLLEPSPRVHLDLSADDVDALARRAVGLGATAAPHEGFVILRSPGGFVFCVVPAGRAEDGEGYVVPGPTSWPEGPSRVDQVCLDLPPALARAEVDFWVALTGWTYADTEDPEFERLTPPAGFPLQILLQTLGDDDGGDVVRAHLDLACADRDAETDRHVALGAAVVRRHEGGYTVLRDPGGLRYCCTARPPR